MRHERVSILMGNCGPADDVRKPFAHCDFDFFRYCRVRVVRRLGYTESRRRIVHVRRGEPPRIHNPNRHRRRYHDATFCHKATNVLDDRSCRYRGSHDCSRAGSAVGKTVVHPRTRGGAEGATRFTGVGLAESDTFAFDKIRTERAFAHHADHEVQRPTCSKAAASF